MVWLTSGDLVLVNLGGFWSPFEVPVLLLLCCVRDTVTGMVRGVWAMLAVPVSGIFVYYVSSLRGLFMKIMKSEEKNAVYKSGLGESV